MDSGVVIFIALLIGVLFGVVSFLFLNLRFSKNFISKKEVDEKYVLRSHYDFLKEQLSAARTEVQDRERRLTETERELAARKSDLRHMQEKLDLWEQELKQMQEQTKLHFESLANRLLEEKSRKFTDENQRRLNELLNPLREKIREFSQDIEKRFTDEAKEVVSLKKEIEHLKELNQQISTDARNLALALKGDSKTQGDWGEIQLERLLEKAGLQRDINYRVQQSFKDDSGKGKRPDFIIMLPGDKNLIVDCKVSLKAYEQYFNCDDEVQRTHLLRQHINSLRNHIKDLAGKNYQHLYQINSPDYVLLFVPIEPAFTVAMQHDHNLFLEALEKNIVLVSTSTLLATMRTVAFIWQQEKQRQNVEEIARESGALYDKFVAFIKDMQAIGHRLKQAGNAYDAAMNKLCDSRRFADTLVGRAERIRQLGAVTKKEMPPDLLSPANDDLTD